MSDQQPFAFRQLQIFIAEHTARKPRKRIASPKIETANTLTRKMVLHIHANEGFASRLASTGTYRADLKKFVSSQQVAGLPDVVGCIKGQFLGVEIKVGRDGLSDSQKQTHAALADAGATIYVARDFEDFTTFFSASFLAPPFI